MGEAQKEQTPAEKIDAAIKSLGLTMTAVFVPFSQSRNAKPEGKDGRPWRSLNWQVTVKRAGVHVGGSYTAATRDILTTDYSQGEAHCPAYKADVKTLGPRDCIMRAEAIRREIETGVSYRGAKITPPALRDVLASLVMDASVLDAGGFGEWAGDLGYATDSRKAEATYRACLDIALKLRNGIGEAGLQQLRDACQDY